ncbi:hypothetical protein B9Z55_011045 [Caenorhabditis nigoni]|uniref:Uncharacterized protein n=1 Tax=Caenorhabditis nigoni TaxID=1611254 RepID=A0A2G5UIE3_9PELO|nr:hypothetical protein B9Z55_011045 [Caenorhabditis nigoni]
MAQFTGCRTKPICTKLQRVKVKNAKIVRTSRAQIFQVGKSAHRNAEKDARISYRDLSQNQSCENVVPHYGQLNPHPSLWQILFDNQDASQNDADDLIIRTEDEDDGHLLIQDLVEEQQPVQNVHQQNDSEEIFNRRDFDSNDDQVQKSMTSAYAKIRCSR